MSDTNNDIQFFGWNIGQANREEAFPQTRWDVRSQHVKLLINSVNADVVALIELRDLSTSKENANAFLAYFADKYDHEKRRYCHYQDCFQMALLYKPEKFFVGDTRIHSYDQDPSYDKIIMFVDLQEKASKRWFTVGITHFDLPEDKKWRSTYIARNLILEQRYPCLVYGDFNFFDDRDGDGQRKHMLHAGLLRDLAAPFTLPGTFIGFPHDEHKQSFEKPGRLDHIFATKSIISTRQASSPYLGAYALDNRSYETYTYPSDHLAIKLGFRLA